MGVTIQYRGKISDKRIIFQLIEEVEDIAKTEGWLYQTLNENWAMEPTAKLESSEGPGIQIVGHTGLKGLRFQPHPECESVWLFFNYAGILTTPFRVALDAEEHYPKRKSWVSTKTQFSTLATHVKIINLFRYLKKKYIHDLELMDETGYWETADLQVLEKYYNREEALKR